MVSSGRISGPGSGDGRVSGARDRRRSTASFWGDDSPRAGDGKDRGIRGYIRIEGVKFDRNAPRGTYVNILV